MGRRQGGREGEGEDRWEMVMRADNGERRFGLECIGNVAFLHFVFCYLFGLVAVTRRSEYESGGL